MARYELVMDDPQIGWINGGYGETEESDSLDELYLVARSLWALGDGGDYRDSTFGARELETGDIVAEWPPEDVADVSLYEDNAGTLYLTRGHVAYVLPDGLAGATFADDAPALAEGDTDQWTLDPLPAAALDTSHPETALIATYDVALERLTIHRAPGLAGAAYLGLSRADLETCWDFPLSRHLHLTAAR